MVRMVPGSTVIDGVRWRYAVSDNEATAGGEPVWAVNVHGYLAGGSMYWRESTRLAAAFGWRVVNPSLPGFGGSSAMAEGTLSLGGLADGLARLLDHLGAGRVVVLGHSFGGAVAVRFARDHGDRVLGLVYRDGAGTPSWRRRRNVLGLLGAAVADLPDFAFGRPRSTLAALLPDARRNLRRIGDVLPVAEVLFTTDLRADVEALAADGVPMLAVWGRLDRLSPARTAREFAAHAGVEPLWVAGGHSWMLARPSTQVEVLRT